VTMAQEDETDLACMLRYGGPECILFIHGLGASKNSFETCFQLASFSDYTLASLDLPGCGESQCPDAFSCTMKDQADLVLQWIRQMDLAPLHIVGHSMGGVIGLYLAESLGPEVKTFFNLEGNLGERDCTFSDKITSLTMEVFETRGIRQFKRTLRELMEGDASPGLKTYYESISRCSAHALYLSAASLVKESRQGSLKKRFLNIPMKKWYVFGERSMDLYTRKFLEYHHIPYFVVPGSGHFMMDDQPHLFFKMLLEAIQTKE
jgi:pimeloyl-ACP methyl ester carboxylesterase